MNSVVSERMEDLARLCEERRVARLDVFGSAATGEFNPETSDLDFLVAFREPADDEFRKSMDLGYALEALFGRKVDVVSERSITNPYFRANVEDTREPVYPKSAAAVAPPRKNGRGDKAVITRRIQCSLLRDIVESAEIICDETENKTLNDYLRDRRLRSDVERQYIIIGEAMAQLARRSPGMAERFTNHRAVIDFRNVLVHRYSEIDNEKVWNHTTKDLPPLLREAQALLAECEE